ncbi:MAG: DUF3368 domain-containing protein [Bacteroidota bacterium]
MIVVSDTSVISNLLQIRQFSLLEKLFHDVVIPSKVYQELLAFHAPEELAPLIQSEAVAVKSIADLASFQKFSQAVDEGEAEAIVLALELKADLLLVDDMEARQMATGLGIKITGLLGVLLEAKLAGHLASLAPVLEMLKKKTGFWISDWLYRKILKDAGE